jgi:hypothetical protein
VDSIDSDSIMDPSHGWLCRSAPAGKGWWGAQFLAVETEILGSEVEDPIINSGAIGEEGGVRHYPKGQIHRP